MIPGGLFTTVAANSAFLPPNDLPYTPLSQTVWGGVAIGDTSGGRLAKYWTVDYANGSINVKPVDGPIAFTLPVLNYSYTITNNGNPDTKSSSPDAACTAFAANMNTLIPGAAPWVSDGVSGLICSTLTGAGKTLSTWRVTPTSVPVDVLSVSLAFDSNMGLVISYMLADGAYLYYFDTITSAFITRRFPGASSCHVCVDDARGFYTSNSDVTLVYTLNNKLYYRKQRDRYDVEIHVGDTTGTIVRVGQNIGNRLQIELTVSLDITSRQQAFKANTSKGILIPFYQDPIGFSTNANCANLIALIKKYPQVPVSVILNPNSGPGSAVNADYTALIDGLQAAGATVLGYVASGFATTATRTVETVSADIDLWKSFYPKINSIFIDEMSNVAGNEQFYVTIRNYCNNFGLFPVVSNAGTTIPQSYFDVGASDIYVDYENTSYPTEAAISGAYGGSYANTNYNDRAAIIYGVPFDLVNLNLLKKYFGLVYLTDTTLPNPYLNTGTYLESVISNL